MVLHTEVYTWGQVGPQLPCWERRCCSAPSRGSVLGDRMGPAGPQTHGVLTGTPVCKSLPAAANPKSCHHPSCPGAGRCSGLFPPSRPLDGLPLSPFGCISVGIGEEEEENRVAVSRQPELMYDLLFLFLIFSVVLRILFS